LANPKPVLIEEITVQLIASTVSQAVFVADDNYQVVGVQAVAEVLGGSGATVTVEVLTGVQAPGAGVAQLSSALVLNGTAHQVQTGSLIASPTTAVAGNRIGIVMAGTLTGLVGSITIAIQRVWAGSDTAYFTVTGAGTNPDNPFPNPTLMTYGVAQATANSFGQKYRGVVYTVKDVYGNAVYTSPTYVAAGAQGS
jgi:hypothetical protein